MSDFFNRLPDRVQSVLFEHYDVWDTGVAIRIPRMDLYVVYRMLKRLNDVIVSDEQRATKIRGDQNA